MTSSTARRQDAVYSSQPLGLPQTTQQEGAAVWSQDAQCLVLNGRRAFILTPHPPSVQSVPTSGASRAGAADADAPTGGPDLQLIAMHRTEIEAQGAAPYTNNGARGGTSAEGDFWDGFVEASGGKAPIPGESEGSMVIYERVKHWRAGTWSPLGLGRLGGCVLALLSNDLEITVFEAQRDHLQGKYQVISFLSRSMAKDKLEAANQSVPSTSTSKGKGKSYGKSKARDSEDKEGRKKPPTLQSALETRSNCLAWSQQIPAPPGTSSAFNVDGSLLAIGNRAGSISLWSHGREGEGMQTLEMKEVASSWITSLCWSRWTLDSAGKASAHLTFVDSEQQIFDLEVTREYFEDDGWDLSWDELIGISIDNASDGRTVTAIKWVNDILVWTKPGTVHMYSASWSEVKELRLSRVGNWAGCNSFEQCIGIHFMTPSTLVIVLAGLTYHIIRNLDTDPKFAPAIESLRATQSARKAMLARRSPGNRNVDEKSITSSTGAWSGLDEWGGVVCWAAEPLQLHDLSYTQEAERNSVFCMMDQQNELETGDEQSLLERVKETFQDPPSCLFTSPNKVALPWILNILHSVEPEAATKAVLALCGTDAKVTGMDTTEVGGDISRVLFGDRRLDRWRLQYVMARWCASRGLDSTVADGLGDRITKWYTERFLAWLDKECSSRPIGPLDRAFLAVQAARAEPFALPAGLKKALGREVAVEPCPICDSAVTATGSSGSEGRCARGHLWSRCSVTHLLLTNSRMRVCATCGTRAHIAGKPDEQGWIKETLLNAAQCCVICGGRWLELP